MESVRIEPCVVERKYRFIFENKITFDLRPKYRFEFKKFLTDLYPILKLYIIVLPKNYNRLFDSRMKIYIIQCVQLTCA